MRRPIVKDSSKPGPSLRCTSIAAPIMRSASADRFLDLRVSVSLWFIHVLPLLSVYVANRAACRSSMGDSGNVSSTYSNSRRSADTARRRGRSGWRTTSDRASSQQARERGDLAARGRGGLGGRDRQPLDGRRRHMGGHAKPDEVVDDEAVEEPAQEVLRARRAAACAGRRRCAWRRSRRAASPR